MRGLFLDAIAGPVGIDYPGMWGVLLLMAVVVVFVVLAAIKNIRDKHKK